MRVTWPDTLPRQVFEDREFAAALYLLASTTLQMAGGGRGALLTAKVSIARRDIDWDCLLEASRTWSHGEQLLVQLALDLWGARRETRVWDLISTLDDGNFRLCLEAIAIRRGKAEIA